MPKPARVFILSLTGLLAISQAACNMVPQRMLHQSQLRTKELYNQNKALAQNGNAANRSLQSTLNDRGRIQGQNSQLQSELDQANQRYANLRSGHDELKQKYVSLLGKNQQSPLSERATQRFQNLGKRYENFEFNPITGVSKFDADILFDSGSDRLKSSAEPLLREFASILNDGTANELNILVVGHTDDKLIVKSNTKSRHPSNWHLSTNRANSVVLALKKHGIKEGRMGSKGYSMFQPLTANSDDRSRQANRRVEIYVLAPDAVVEEWDPVTSR